METREPFTLINEGQKIVGVIHHPSGLKKAPYVLFCHGLAGHKIGKHRMYVNLAEKLSAKGIGSLRFDFRGAGDSEGLHSQITLESKMSDAKKMIAYLLSLKGVDPKRIGIYGRSLGGLVAVLLASQTPSIKSIALWSPYFSGEQWQRMWLAFRSGALNKEQKEQLLTFNTQLTNEEFFNQLFKADVKSCMQALKDRDFMVVAAGKDDVFEPYHAQNYMKYREGASGITELITYPNCDHNFSIPNERHEAIERTVEWFVDTL